jgi:hypothetical protein
VLDTLLAAAPEFDFNAGAFGRLTTRRPDGELLKVANELRVVDWASAIRLLCSSKRVAHDVKRNCAILLRSCGPLVEWSEVRVFVSAGRVTAASQYGKAGCGDERKATLMASSRSWWP